MIVTAEPLSSDANRSWTVPFAVGVITPSITALLPVAAAETELAVQPPVPAEPPPPPVVLVVRAELKLYAKMDAAGPVAARPMPVPVAADV